MNVAIVAPFDLRRWDGTTIRVTNMVISALHTCDRVTLLSHTVNETIVKHELSSKLVWIEIRRVRPLISMPLSMLSCTYGLGKSVSKAVLSLYGLSEDQCKSLKSVDIIHTHWVENLALANAIRSAVGSRAPIVLDIHGLFSLQEPLAGSIRDYLCIWLGRALERTALKSSIVKGVTVPSEELKDYISRRCGVPPDKIFVVHDVVSEIELKPDSLAKSTRDSYGKSIRKVCYCGTLSSYHGFYDLVLAFKMLSAAIDNVVLKVITSNEEPLTQLLKKNVISKDKVELLKNIPRKSLLRHLEDCDVLVLPHRAKTQFEYIPSNKIYDYMMSCKPIVAYDIPIIRRMLSKYPYKILVKPNDPPSLMQGIMHALKNLSDRYTERCRDLEEIIPTLPLMIKELKYCYSSLVPTRG